ncbi:MAG: glutamine amidotransferase [Myxococcota bacterium]
MKPVVIVKTGKTIASIEESRGDFEDWISAGLGVGPEWVRVSRVDEGEELPEPEAVAGAVVTGSSAMVTAREAWSERAAGWLSAAVAREVPILGICYGHQLLAHALGGTVRRNPNGREIGTVDVALAPGADSDSLFAEFDGGLRVHASHLESVTALPPGAIHLASSSLDPNHAFRVGRNAWGVQFHPEFDADIMRGYLAARREAVLSEGLDADALTRAVEERPEGFAVLRRFSAIICS